MKKLLCLLLALSPLAAVAADERIEPNGTATRAWLELQQSGREAAPGVRPMSGEVADQVYQRYLDSFSQPIPQSLGRERFVSGTGGDS